MSKINWAEVMEANRDTIIEKMVQAKKETEGTMQGWGVDVEIDENGDCWVSGLLSQNSQSMSSYKGETFIVATVKSWEVDVNEEEAIKTEPEMLKEYLAQQNEDGGHEYAYQFMAEKYPEKVEEWRTDTIEYEVDAYAEEADRLLDQRIEDEKLYFRTNGAV